MKKNIWILLIILVLIIGGVIFWQFQLKKEAVPPEEKETEKAPIEGYLIYHSANRKTPFSVFYPEEWVVEEEVLQLNGDLTFGIREPDKEVGPEGFLSGFQLRASPTQDIDGKVKDFIEFYEDFEGFQIVSDTETTIDGYKAREISISYKDWLPFEAPRQKEYEITETTVFVLKDKYVYRLNFGAVGEDAVRYQEIFQRMSESFKFSR